MSSVAEESLHRALGLTDDEFAAVGDILGRPPNHLELALYAVMWSASISDACPPRGPGCWSAPGRTPG